VERGGISGEWERGRGVVLQMVAEGKTNRGGGDNPKKNIEEMGRE